MPSPKPLLTIMAGGILLGTLVGKMADPVMKFADEPDWRSRFESRFSSTPMQFVAAGPEDLDPGSFGPSYRGPNYLPAYFAADRDLPYDSLLPADHAEPAHNTVADAEFEEPVAPPPIERASEDAAGIAAVPMELPPPRITDSPGWSGSVPDPATGAASATGKSLENTAGDV